MTSLPEIRQACRALWVQPTWTVAALLCLAIGTGANTAVFSLINGILLRPLPFAEPEQIVTIAIQWPDDRKAGPVSIEQFRDVSEASALFQQLAIRTFLPVGLALDGPSRMTQAEFVSGSYFELLRVSPTSGRMLSEEADRPGVEIQVVLSEKLWRTRFNRDHSIVGRTVRVNGRPAVVAGIAPTGFVGAMQLISADIWLPASSYASFASAESPREAESRREFGLIGRLQPGFSLERTREQLAAVLGNQSRAREASGAAPAVEMVQATGFGVPPGLRQVVISGSALLFGLMALLVSVAIANVAGLMLARAAGRQKEIAVRLALGASPSQIVRQVMTESFILSIAGACLGALLAAALPSLLDSLQPNLPDHISFAVDLRPDWRTVAYAIVSAVAVAVLFGLAPARHAATTSLHLTLRASAGNSRTRTASRTLNAFVTGQVAVCTVLLVMAVLLSRTYLNMQAVDPGFDIRNTLAVSVDWSQTGADREKGKIFFAQLLSRVASFPGVRSAALTRQPPLAPGGRNFTAVSDSSTSVTAGASVVTAAYFATVRLPLLQGRTFGPADDGAQPVAIINETMARQLWHGASPIGRTFTVQSAAGRSASPRRLEVIGVAKDAKYRSLSETPAAMFYEPFSQAYSAQMTLLARSDGDPRALIKPIQHELQSQHPDLAGIMIRTLEDQFQESTASARQRAVVLAGICVLGLLLSAFGLFGVISYGVRQRVREIGVRMAMGARPANIAILVLRQAGGLVTRGFAIGVILAFGATRVIAAALFGVTAHDPVTVGIVILVLAVVAVSASYLPARWAARVDPMTSIRTE